MASKRKTTSGAASLRNRGLVGMPLTLTREQRDLIRDAALRSGQPGGVSGFAVPTLVLAAEKILGKSEKKDARPIDS